MLNMSECFAMYHVIQLLIVLYRGEAQICIDADLVSITLACYCNVYSIHLCRYWANVLLCQ